MQQIHSIHWAFVMLCAVELSACSKSRLPGSQASSRSVTAQSFSSSSVGRDTSNRSKFNVPSAAFNTPLCGTALHEQAQTGASLYGQSLESGNTCVQNACFQPLTGTFIAQDGTNSVCR